MIAAGSRSAPDKQTLGQNYKEWPPVLCFVRHILAQRLKQLAAMGMCLMNGYEVFKDQTHSPHK
ncbi:MAG: hypothetical protein K2O45_10430, partial [Oscillospiraceae bacterium]|nr:hypothetical protein [Oscillospiraceae bacterium]